MWPVSRPCKPKQFLSFRSGPSLFQATLQRCQAPVFSRKPIVVGANNHRFLLAEDLQRAGVQADVLLEPVARNSCAAITSAVLHGLKRDPNATFLVLAADHHVPDKDAFVDAVHAAREDAKDGRLILFGVRPRRPATGYGYIAPGQKLSNTFQIERFVEKPDELKAGQFIDAGFLWNSGNILFQGKTFLDELKQFEPEVLRAAENALSNASMDLSFIRLQEKPYAQAPFISIDHAVMERTGKGAVLPVDYEWLDVGCWEAVAGLMQGDGNGNAVTGDVDLLNSRNNIVHSEGRLTSLLGMDDHIVVSTRDSVLVAPKSEAQNVKGLVKRLRAQGRKQADEAPQMFRPWGNYEQLDSGQEYQVKRITVKPGAELSLQKHRFRAEHWIVVAGVARVTVGNKTWTLKPNQSTYVPLGEIHRLANPGSEPLILIEVQTGSYLGEDDIVRLEDTYNRSREPLSALE